MKPKPITPLMGFYLACAVAGAIVPWYFNIQHMLHSHVPFTVVSWIEAGMATPLSRSITTDFLIGTTPVLLWIIVEGRRLKMRFLWFYVVFTFLVAFSFTCPLFLFFRERKLQLSQ